MGPTFDDQRQSEAAFLKILLPQIAGNHAGLTVTKRKWYSCTRHLSETLSGKQLETQLAKVEDALAELVRHASVCDLILGPNLIDLSLKFLPDVFLKEIGVTASSGIPTMQKEHSLKRDPPSRAVHV